MIEWAQKLGYFHYTFPTLFLTCPFETATSPACNLEKLGFTKKKRRKKKEENMGRNKKKRKEYPMFVHELKEPHTNTCMEPPSRSQQRELVEGDACMLDMTPLKSSWLTAAEDLVTVYLSPWIPPPSSSSPQTPAYQCLSSASLHLFCSCYLVSSCNHCIGLNYDRFAWVLGGWQKLHFLSLSAALTQLGSTVARRLDCGVLKNIPLWAWSSSRASSTPASGD